MTKVYSNRKVIQQCLYPVLCMASAWVRQTPTTEDKDLKASASSTMFSVRCHTLFSASKAYRRTLKLWLRHDCRMTSNALRRCTTFNITGMEKGQKRQNSNNKTQFFTLSLRCGTMTLRWTSTDRKVQMLVLVCSWACVQNKNSSAHQVRFLRVNRQFEHFISPCWSKPTNSQCVVGSGRGSEPSSTRSGISLRRDCCRIRLQTLASAVCQQTPARTNAQHVTPSVLNHLLHAQTHNISPLCPVLLSETLVPLWA